MTTTSPLGDPFPEKQVNLGWQCPKCGRCYSPNIVLCTYCGPGYSVVTWPTGDSTNPDLGNVYVGPRNLPGMGS